MTNDCVIDAIMNGRLTANNISFQAIRSLCSASISQLTNEEDTRLWESLGRGRNILETTSQLDKYSYTYGPMIEGQWSYVFEQIELKLRPQAHLIDYGCGQGLSTALFLDNYGKESFNSIEKITLIEPSDIALRRAKAIVGCYSDNIEIETVNDTFDLFSARKIEGRTGGRTYHLFSNVLDLPLCNHLEMMKNTFYTSGENIILAVSHDRAVSGGSRQIKECREVLASSASEEKVIIRHSAIEKFKCNDDKNDAIGFAARVEVNNGSV